MENSYLKDDNVLEKLVKELPISNTEPGTVAMLSDFAEKFVKRKSGSGGK
jgi:hypothetical protein